MDGNSIGNSTSNGILTAGHGLGRKLGQNLDHILGRILGVRVHNAFMHAAVEYLISRARQPARTPSFVAFANADCLNIATGNARYRAILNRADRVFADGIGVRIASRLLGMRMADNVNGTDLFPLLCAAAARSGVKLFLLGGQPGVAAEAAQRMSQRYPGLVIAGTHHGFFTDEQTAAVIEEINASGAHILLAGLGAPRQELWLAQHAAQLKTPARCGVGGLFDYYSGRIPRAPQRLRKLGLEWVWRLKCEPMRLWRRYVLGNPLFLLRVLRQRLMGSEAHTALAIRSGNSWSRRLHNLSAALRMRAPLWRQQLGASAKRGLDIVGASCAVLLLSPLLAATAIAIRLESPGGIIFRQQRVGRDGRPFMMFKFRSMCTHAEADKAALLAQNEMAGGVIFKMKDDPRITRVGRFIRRTSIDELPQLFNVLRGEMTLVGPRPPLPSEVNEYTLLDRGRLAAVPGLTCIWQVSGRSEIPFPQQVQMDLDYIHKQSLAEDVRLLAKTVPALLRGRGAY